MQNHIRIETIKDPYPRYVVTLVTDKGEFLIPHFGVELLQKEHDYIPAKARMVVNVKEILG